VLTQQLQEPITESAQEEEEEENDDDDNNDDYNNHSIPLLVYLSTAKSL
jgi:hypothetical protein